MTELLTDAYLAEVRDRAEKATPGPWHTDPCNATPGSYCYGPLIPGHDRPAPPGLMRCTPPIALCHQDAAFIAHAREDVPKLLGEIERLRSALRNVYWRVQKDDSHGQPQHRFYRVHNVIAEMYRREQTQSCSPPQSPADGD